MSKEFGPDFEGKKDLVVRVEYDLKSAGTDFRNNVWDCMKILGLKYFPAEPDI